MKGISEVYVIKSRWVQPGTNPPVGHSSQGTAGYPTREYARMDCEKLNTGHPSITHEPVLAPPKTELLDIVWENYAKYN